MVDSASDAIIANPQAIITKIFDSARGADIPDVSSDFDIPKTFESAFADSNQHEKIPRLDLLPAIELKTGKLVRFLGMVQDTSYSQEIYVGLTKSQNKWTLHRYGEAASGDIDIHSADTILDERNGLYLTSIPGKSTWFNTPESLASLSFDDSSVLKGDKDRVVQRGGNEIGVVVKCYSGVENKLKVCDLVDMIGILEMPSADEDNEDAEDAEDTDVVIHAITVKNRQLHEVVKSQNPSLSSVDVKQTQELFINHVSSLLEGDTLSAQSLLLNLTSFITHRHPTTIGPLTLNIHSLPPHLVGPLITFLKSVLPSVTTESLTVEMLNSQRIYPKSDGEKLFAGRGQMVQRTAVVVDESAMNEGKLGDMGVRNLRFLSRIAMSQKVGFEFPYHEFEIDTDVSFLVLGSSKSILPVTVSFPHVKSSIPITNSQLTQSDLTLLRTYLATISTLNITISESIAEEMQNEFVAQRKEDGGKADEGWFGRRILVAKGLARSGGRESVQREDWKRGCEVCGEWEKRSKK